MRNNGDEQVGRLFAPKLFKQPHERPMEYANGRLQQAQKIDAAERPSILQQHVALLLNSDARQPAKNIKPVSELLKLNELDLPRPLLLGNNCLEDHGSIPVSAASVVKYNVYFLHYGHCYIRFSFAEQSTLDAMWITIEVSCAQAVPWAHLRRIRVLFTDCSYPRPKIDPCDATSTFTRLLRECSTPLA